MIEIGAGGWQLFVAIATLLAFVHAYRKLTPFFAVTWFGAGLVFGWFWTGHRSSPEAVLLPVLVVYLAAAVAKGIVERGALAGNHLVHVLAAGVFGGLIAWPLESSARAMGWITPRGSALRLWPLGDHAWSAGVPPELLLQWAVACTLFYGVYKLLDHIGLGATLQTLVLFGAMPFLPRLVEWVMGCFD
ncbi:MAG TPA: hypothetical protein VFD43_13110 [Planctomycetota bacterium]|nr:hypothetical protein [Planctomycetota bacterium]